MSDEVITEKDNENSVVQPVIASSEKIASEKTHVVSAETAKSGFGMKVLSFLGICVVAGGIGAASGYYAALTVPVPTQIMLFDLDKAMKIAANSVNGESMGESDRLVLLIKERIKQYSDMGVIVIDQASVVGAPPKSIVNIDDIYKQIPVQPIKNGGIDGQRPRFKDLEVGDRKQQISNEDFLADIRRQKAMREEEAERAAARDYEQ